MNAFDQGLERIPEQFLNYCWELCIKAEGKEWETFKSMAMQMRFGGVSSEAEARRLFWAEQIAHKVFFLNDEKPSQIAAQLSEDIQSSFQHVSRPVTLESDEDRQLIEILNYYFANEEALANFDECLKGSFDGVNQEVPFTQKDHNAEIFQPQSENSQNTSEAASFDDDFQLPPTKPQKNTKREQQTLTNPFTDKKVIANSSRKEERPKVHQYLEAKDKRQHYSELSGKIKEIIDEFYSN